MNNSLYILLYILLFVILNDDNNILLLDILIYQHKTIRCITKGGVIHDHDYLKIKLISTTIMIFNVFSFEHFGLFDVVSLLHLCLWYTLIYDLDLQLDN